jgi:hypothetical protein
MKKAKQKELEILSDDQVENTVLMQYLSGKMTDDELWQIVSKNELDVNERFTFSEHTIDGGCTWGPSSDWADDAGAEEWPLYFNYENASLLLYVYLTKGANSLLFNNLLKYRDTQVDATYMESGEGNYFDAKEGSGFKMMNANILHLAIALNDYEAVKKICESKRIDVNTAVSLSFETKEKTKLITQVKPVHLAARWVNINLMKLLIQHGANLEVVDSEGKTVTHYARQTKKDKEHFQEYDSRDSELKELIEIDDRHIMNFFLTIGENGTWWLGRNRLFLGEGDFSFTQAFMKKRNQHHVKPRITATEIQSKSELEKI